MLQAHSILWHYLWVAPNLLLLSLAFLLRKRGLYGRMPAFSAFCIVASIGELAVYAADVVPSVKPEFFWRVYWTNLLIQGCLKFLIVGEIFAQLFGSYVSIARVGKSLIRVVAAIVVLAATFAAAYAPRDGRFAVVSGANFLEQTIYVIETGLLVFLFLFSTYFHLLWDRITLGITMGLSISACVHMAVWAVLANAGLSDSMRTNLIFVKMATYHFSVLLWLYYLLVPGKNAVVLSQTAVPENNLTLWNRELERLLQ